MALCFDQDGHMYVSTFTGVVYAVQLHLNLISIKGTVTSSLQLRSTLLYGIVSLKNVVYVSVSMCLPRRFRATLNFRKFKVALNPLCRIFLNFAKSCILSC